MDGEKPFFRWMSGYCVKNSANFFAFWEIIPSIWFLNGIFADKMNGHFRWFQSCSSCFFLCLTFEFCHRVDDFYVWIATVIGANESYCFVSLSPIYLCNISFKMINTDGERSLFAAWVCRNALASAASNKYRLA